MLGTTINKISNIKEVDNINSLLLNIFLIKLVSFILIYILHTSYSIVKKIIYNYNMKKVYKIEVDCANCANKMEEIANTIKGVKKAIVNFMTLKMIVEFEESAIPEDVIKEVREKCKKVEDDFEIYI